MHYYHCCWDAKQPTNSCRQASFPNGSPGLSVRGLPVGRGARCVLIGCINEPFSSTGVQVTACRVVLIYVFLWFGFLGRLEAKIRWLGEVSREGGEERETVRERERERERGGGERERKGERGGGEEAGGRQGEVKVKWNQNVEYNCIYHPTKLESNWFVNARMHVNVKVVWCTQ